MFSLVNACVYVSECTSVFACVSHCVWLCVYVFLCACVRVSAFCVTVRLSLSVCVCVCVLFCVRVIQCVWPVLLCVCECV